MFEWIVTPHNVVRGWGVMGVWIARGESRVERSRRDRTGELVFREPPSTRCARSVEARARRPISPDRVRGGRAPLDIRSCETKLSKDKLFYGPRIEHPANPAPPRARAPPAPGAASAVARGPGGRAVVLRVACDCARQRDRTADLVTSRSRRLSTPRRYKAVHVPHSYQPVTL